MDLASTFSKFGRVVGSFVRANMPRILTACVIGGTATTATVAVTGTIKACKEVERIKEETGKEKLTVKETVAATWKFYIPTALSFATTTACAIGSLAESERRTAALATAYQIAETARESFIQSTEEVVGKKKTDEIKANDSEKRLKTDPEDSVIYAECTKFGNVLFRDSITGRYFRSSHEAVKGAVNDFNKNLLEYDSLDLNDFYYRLEIESDTEVGKYLGFNAGTSILDIYFTDSHHPISGEPCAEIMYHSMPYYMFDRSY